MAGAGIDRPDVNHIALIWCGVSVGAFHAAWLIPGLGFLMVVFLYAIIRASGMGTARAALWLGLIVGAVCYGPYLWFLSGASEVGTKLGECVVPALWIGGFTLIVHELRAVIGRRAWLFVLFVAMIWMGLEYGRCEYFGATWLSAGAAMGGTHDGSPLISLAGVFGAGFLLSALAAFMSLCPWRSAVYRMVCAWAALWAIVLLTPALGYSGPAVLTVFVHLESTSDDGILKSLEAARTGLDVNDAFPFVFLVGGSTLTAPPNEGLREWCRTHRQYLLIGGSEPVNGGAREMALVIDPEGRVVFTQSKRVGTWPFASDRGSEPHIWQARGGAVGICVGADISRTHVIDELIGKGAQTVIAIGSDSDTALGITLQARVAGALATEHHVDILEVWATGATSASRYGGWNRWRAESRRIPLDTRVSPRIPIDRVVAPFFMIAAAAAAVYLAGRRIVMRWKDAVPENRQIRDGGS